MYRYVGKNIRPFSAICHNSFGRKVIYTNQDFIDSTNIVGELTKALSVHIQNAMEIDYLDRYYRGDQPILYRQKNNRPEINNKVKKNLAFFIVETKTADMCGEPIQYVLSEKDDSKADDISLLNKMMKNSGKASDDEELCRWRSICGTSYRFIGDSNDSKASSIDEEFVNIYVEDPRDAFVVYWSSDKKHAAFSVQIRNTVDGKKRYVIFTNTHAYEIIGGEITKETLNGNRSIPLVEYPNNSRRLSDVELTIEITDEINKTSSDQSNGIEGFVSSWVKFVNCEIDSETYKKMRQEGALVVKSNNGSENKADVDVMSCELNQSQTQVVVDDNYDKLLVIQGLAGREGNTGGDTGNAVSMRNGWTDAEKRAELSEHVFVQAEKKALAIILNRLRIEKGMNLAPSDVEVKICRTKTDNIMTKCEALQMLLNAGVHPERAFKLVSVFPDPEQAYIESKDRLDILYPTDVESVVETETKVKTDNEVTKVDETEN